MTLRDPLYKVQQAAFDQTLSEEERKAAILELGMRYARGVDGARWYTETYIKRLAGAYVKGFTGSAEIRTGYQRGGNWARPLWTAWFVGKRDARELRILITEAAGDK